LLASPPFMSSSFLDISGSLPLTYMPKSLSVLLQSAFYSSLLSQPPIKHPGWTSPAASFLYIKSQDLLLSPTYSPVVNL
jgi:hypothetical protein